MTAANAIVTTSFKKYRATSMGQRKPSPQHDA
nr:MAG TPA: hypothetical protein [Caudoviricetes sp.]